MLASHLLLRTFTSSASTDILNLLLSPMHITCTSMYSAYLILFVLTILITILFDERKMSEKTRKQSIFASMIYHHLLWISLFN